MCFQLCIYDTWKHYQANEKKERRIKKIDKFVKVHFFCKKAQLQVIMILSFTLDTKHIIIFLSSITLFAFCFILSKLTHYLISVHQLHENEHLLNLQKQYISVYLSNFLFFFWYNNFQTIFEFTNFKLKAKRKTEKRRVYLKNIPFLPKKKKKTKKITIYINLFIFPKPDIFLSFLFSYFQKNFFC